LQPPLLKATSLAPAAQRWLQTSTAARVLHVFDNACNLANEKGEVLSLVTAAAGNAPFTVVVAPAVGGPLSFARLVDVQTPVTLRDSGLVVGSLVVEWGSATLWQPRPPWQQLRRRLSTWQRHLPSLRAHLCAWTTRAPASAPSALARLWQSAFEPAAALQSAAAAGDLAGCGLGAARLAGLGEGLTPAGDDFLVGVMAALWSCFAATDAAHLAGAMAEAAVPRTTLLSGAWLRAAARGEAAASWHLLVEALASNEGAAVRRAGQRILRTGHTSGAAALAGFLSASLSRSARLSH
jgi:hypothetical protein